MIRSPAHRYPLGGETHLAAMSIDPNPVLLEDATLEQIVQAISAKIEAKDLIYSEEVL